MGHSGSRLPRMLAIASATILVAACTSVPPEPHLAPDSDSLRVASYNVHFAYADGTHPRSHAADVADVLHLIFADIIGLQEVSTLTETAVVRPCPFLAALKTELSSYEWIAPNGASILSQTTPILYRPERFMPVSQGIEWLSPTSDVPDSTGWGNVMPRHVTWARFYDAASGCHVVVLNVHLDHLSRIANRRALTRVCEFVEHEFAGDPIILTGDLNEPVLSPGRLDLSRLMHPVLHLAHGPTRAGIVPMQIDAIYVSDHFAVGAADILHRSAPDAGELIASTSDHRPVLADLTFECLGGSGE